MHSKSLELTDVQHRNVIQDIITVFRDLQHGYIATNAEPALRKLRSSLTSTQPRLQQTQSRLAVTQSTLTPIRSTQTSDQRVSSVLKYAQQTPSFLRQSKTSRDLFDQAKDSVDNALSAIVKLEPFASQAQCTIRQLQAAVSGFNQLLTTSNQIQSALDQALAALTQEQLAFAQSQPTYEQVSQAVVAIREALSVLDRAGAALLQTDAILQQAQCALQTSKQGLPVWQQTQPPLQQAQTGIPQALFALEKAAKAQWVEAEEAQTSLQEAITGLKRSLCTLDKEEQGYSALPAALEDVSQARADVDNEMDVLVDQQSSLNNARCYLKQALEALTALQQVIEVRDSILELTTHGEMQVLREKLGALERSHLALNQQMTDLDATSGNTEKQIANLKQNSEAHESDLKALTNRYEEMQQAITMNKEKQNTIVLEMQQAMKDTEERQQQMQQAITTNKERQQAINEGTEYRLSALEKSASVPATNEQSSIHSEEDETRLQDYLHQTYKKDEGPKMSIAPSSYDVPLSKVFTTIVIRDDLSNNKELCGKPGDRIEQLQEAGQKSEKEKKQIDSFHEMFHKGNVLQRNTYLLGQAGSGKTTFCNHVVDVWCRSSSKPQFKDTEEITNFEYVFRVSCRDAEINDTLLDMILSQLFDSDADYLHSVVKHVVKTKPEKCLILVDGLDEWAGSPSKSTGARSPCGIPNKKGLEQCVVLVTSRPWRVEALRQGLGKHLRILEIQGLAISNLKELSNNLLSILNLPYRSRTFKTFWNDVKSAKMTKIVKTPMMLLIVLTTWLSARKLDISISVNFMRMIECSIQRAEGQSGRTDDTNRLVDILHLDKFKSDWAKQNSQLPCCFSNMHFCQQYAPLIYKLANFAFDALFHEIPEKALVFSIEKLESVFKKPELEACLAIGILSLAPAQGKSDKRMAHVSFVHKSLQEYLAALWMAGDNFRQCLTVFNAHCNCVQDVLDVSNVVLFVSGLSPDTGRELWGCIVDVTGTDPVVQQHRQSVCSRGGTTWDKLHGERSVVRLHQLSLDCSSEAYHTHPALIQSDRRLNLYMVPDKYVGPEMSALSEEDIFEELTNVPVEYKRPIWEVKSVVDPFLVAQAPSEIRSLIADDICLNEVLEKTLQKLVNLERLHISIPTFNGRIAPQQHSQLCSAISKLTSLRSLYMDYCSEASNTYMDMYDRQWSPWSAFKSLFRTESKLSLTPPLTKFAIIDRSPFRSLISIRLSCPLNMTSLELDGVTLRHTSIVSLSSLLCSTSTLQELTIRLVTCFDCGRVWCTYDVDLTKNSHLECLTLGRSLGVQSVRVSPDMARLMEIRIDGIEMQADAWRNFLLSLPRPARGLIVMMRGSNIDIDSVSYIERHFIVHKDTTNRSGDRELDFGTPSGISTLTST